MARNEYTAEEDKIIVRCKRNELSILECVDRLAENGYKRTKESIRNRMAYCVKIENHPLYGIRPFPFVDKRVSGYAKSCKGSPYPVHKTPSDKIEDLRLKGLGRIAVLHKGTPAEHVAFQLKKDNKWVVADVGQVHREWLDKCV